MFACLWADEGDIVHPDGAVERTRHAIRSARVELFMRREYRDSSHPLAIGNIRFPTYVIALVDGKWELRGVTDSAGLRIPPMTGLFTMVLRRAGGGWEIYSWRYSMDPPAGQPPTISRPRPGA